jgi:toxin ParE1/3/4
MTALRYRYSDEAKGDLVDIRKYLKHHASAKVAARMVSRLKQAVARACEMPAAGVPKPDYQPNCRFVVERPYLIYYDFDGDTMTILRVLHSARDRNRIMGEDEQD